MKLPGFALLVALASLSSCRTPPADSGVPGPSGEGVRCEGCAAARFPSFDQSCSAAVDCVLREHESQRFTSSAALGVNRGAVARFDAAEAACRAQMGDACISPVVHVVTTDDGQMVGTDQAVVACVNHKCTTAKRAE